MILEILIILQGFSGNSSSPQVRMRTSAHLFYFDIIKKMKTFH